MNAQTNETESLAKLHQLLQARAALSRKAHPNPDWKYGAFEELVLACGTAMEIKPLPKGIKKAAPGRCYFNSQQLAFKKKHLVYVEGYVLVPDISFPIAHAWLLTLEGHGIDPTLEPPGTAYLGIPFCTQWLKSVLASRKQKGRDNDLSIIEGSYLEDYALLKQGIPADAYHKL
jgi:hypothetical protein